MMMMMDVEGRYNEEGESTIAELHKGEFSTPMNVIGDGDSYSLTLVRLMDGCICLTWRSQGPRRQSQNAGEGARYMGC